MEQKRTLWIVLAAGIFLLVVFGAACIMSSSDSNGDGSALTLRKNGSIWVAPNSVSMNSGTSYTGDFTSAPASKTEELEPVNSITDDIVSPAEGETQLLTAENFEQGIAQTENVTVIANGSTTVFAMDDAPSVIAKNSAAEKEIRETGRENRIQEKSVIEEPASALAASRKTSSYEDTSARAVTKATTSYSAPAVKSSKKYETDYEALRSTSAVNKTAASAPMAKKIPDRFWVQAASYSSKKNADEARAVLDENKIQCEVFTYTDSSDKMYYRVRTGPYTTKSEAQYWQKRIDSIPLFSKNNSYITNTSK